MKKVGYLHWEDTETCIKKQRNDENFYGQQELCASDNTLAMHSLLLFIA
jgi:hypothetical protein